GGSWLSSPLAAAVPTLHPNDAAVGAGHQLLAIDLDLGVGDRAALRILDSQHRALTGECRGELREIRVAAHLVDELVEDPRIQVVIEASGAEGAGLNALVG